jgi:DNA-directed RNA polymerase specialized sigma24 family protein
MIFPHLLDSPTHLHGTPWRRLWRHIEVAAWHAYQRHGEIFPFEDYLSAGLLAVAQSLQRYDATAGASFAWYAERTMTFAMIQVVKDLCRQPPVVWEPVDPHWPTLAEPMEPAETAVEALLVHCTPVQAYCVRRCWLDGQPPMAVARELDCHVSNVLRRLQMARRRLVAAIQGPARHATEAA